MCQNKASAPATRPASLAASQLVNTTLGHHLSLRFLLAQTMLPSSRFAMVVVRVFLVAQRCVSLGASCVTQHIFRESREGGAG